MIFSLLAERYSVYRFPPGRIPAIDLGGEDFVCLAGTAEEVSLVCRSGIAEGAEREEEGWRVLKLAGPVDFGVVGVLAEASTLLATAGVSIFAVSTFDTDYILVKDVSLGSAVEALEGGGHRIVGYGLSIEVDVSAEGAAFGGGGSP